VLELWANELERRSRLPPSLPSRDQQDSLSDEAPDPLRMMDDAQVESGVFGSGTDVLPDIVRPFRSVSDVLQLAMHELYELNSVLCQKKVRVRAENQEARWPALLRSKAKAT
jgi:hypothetical protein